MILSGKSSSSAHVLSSTHAILVLYLNLVSIATWMMTLLQKCKICSYSKHNCNVLTALAFVAGWLGFISRNYVVWPTFFLINVFIALKGSLLSFLFEFTAAGVMQCGGRKTSPRTSTINNSNELMVYRLFPVCVYLWHSKEQQIMFQIISMATVILIATEHLVWMQD